MVYPRGKDSCPLIKPITLKTTPILQTLKSKCFHLKRKDVVQACIPLSLTNQVMFSYYPTVSDTYLMLQLKIFLCCTHLRLSQTANTKFGHLCKRHKKEIQFSYESNFKHIKTSQVQSSIHIMMNHLKLYPIHKHFSSFSKQICL